MVELISKINLNGDSNLEKLEKLRKIATSSGAKRIGKGKKSVFYAEFDSWNNVQKYIYSVSKNGWNYVEIIPKQPKIL